MRGLNSAVNAAIREVKRQHRINQREAERQDRYRRGNAAIQEFNDLVESLCSLHKDCVDVKDWHSLQQIPPPPEPARSSTNEHSARQKLRAFRPNLVHKLLNRVEKQRLKLARAVEAGRMQDDLIHKEELNKHAADLAQWKNEQEVCRRVMAGDINTYEDIVQRFQTLSTLVHFGKSFEVGFGEPKIALCNVYPHDQEVIPRSRPTLLKSGKLSEKILSKSDFHQCYMDYVCSASLRAARELLALLPLNCVIVNVIMDCLDEATGHTHPRSILSYLVSQDELSGLNVDGIRPSSTILTFHHKVAFQKTRGFKPIEPFDANDVRKFYSLEHG